MGVRLVRAQISHQQIQARDQISNLCSIIQCITLKLTCIKPHFDSIAVFLAIFQSVNLPYLIMYSKIDDAKLQDIDLHPPPSSYLNYETH